MPGRSLICLFVSWCLTLTCCATARDFLRIDYHVWERHQTQWPPADLRPIQALDVLIYFRTDDPDDAGRVVLPAEAVARLAELKKAEPSNIPADPLARNHILDALPTQPAFHSTSRHPSD